MRKLMYQECDNYTYVFDIYKKITILKLLAINIRGAFLNFFKHNCMNN